MMIPDATALTALLHRHLPLLRYDSQEPYWADSAAIWTDNPGNALRRASGEVLAAATPSEGEKQLSLDFLKTGTYADSTPVTNTDAIADPGHDYPAQARAMHARVGYPNRVYGHWATGSDARIWLAYWFFYFYNDYNLLGPLLPAGLHEGDWEMIQLRLNQDASAPDLALYAQHTHAQSRTWDEVEKVGQRPVVYPARGSHASYFNPGPHWTGYWFDHADGRRAAAPLTLEILSDNDPDQAWVHWPGMWGGTLPKPGLDRELEDSSPRGPGGHAQWRDPASLQQHVKAYLVAPASALAALPAAPTLQLRRAGDQLIIQWRTSMPVAQLIVSITDGDQPPLIFRPGVSGREGTVEISASLIQGQGYEINASVATSDGRPSPSTQQTVSASP